MAAEVNVLDIIPPCKRTIKSRFSGIRYMKVVNKLNSLQRSFIYKHKLQNLLNFPDHLMVPLHLQQWLVSHTSYGYPRFFQHKDKTIHFSKDIVDKVFGFPSGNKHFITESRDPNIISEVGMLREQYLLGEKQISVKNLEAILLGANTEVVFMRSFMMYFIRTILCPSTYEAVNPKYLYSLRDSDMPEVGILDYGSLCLKILWEEMDAWKDRIPTNVMNVDKVLWIGGCLPLLGVVYLDFVNFGGIIWPISYALPRMANISNADFTHLVHLDRNVRSPKSYGVMEWFTIYARSRLIASPRRSSDHEWGPPSMILPNINCQKCAVQSTYMCADLYMYNESFCTLVY